MEKEKPKRSPPVTDDINWLAILIHYGIWLLIPYVILGGRTDDINFWEVFGYGIGRFVLLAVVLWLCSVSTVLLINLHIRDVTPWIWLIPFSLSFVMIAFSILESASVLSDVESGYEIAFAVVAGLLAVVLPLIDGGEFRLRNGMITAVILGIVWGAGGITGAFAGWAFLDAVFALDPGYGGFVYGFMSGFALAATLTGLVLILRINRARGIHTLFGVSVQLRPIVLATLAKSQRKVTLPDATNGSPRTGYFGGFSIVFIIVILVLTLLWVAISVQRSQAVASVPPTPTRFATPTRLPVNPTSIPTQDIFGQIVSRSTETASSLRAILDNAPDCIQRPILSPQRLLFTTQTSSTASIFIAEATNIFSLCLLVPDVSLDTTLTMSPDGLSVAFNNGGSVVILGSQTGEMTLVHDQALRGSGLSWSPTGDRLLFSMTSGNRVDIAVYSTTENSMSNLTGIETFEYHANPVWSPDGQTIAFVSSQSIDSMEATVTEMDVSGGNRREISSPLSRYPAWLSVSWSPDAQSLIVTETENNTSRLLVIDVASGVERTLILGERLLSSPRWANSQTIIYQSNTGPIGSVYEADLNGNIVRSLSAGIPVRSFDYWSM